MPTTKQDAAGQAIIRRDMVRLITSPASAAPNRRYGMVVRANPPGTKVVVRLVDGTEVTADARDILVVDRSYLRPGTTVVSASDTGGQLGVITGADVELDLLWWPSDRSGETITTSGVSPAGLRRVRELCVGDYVVSAGHWLGRVLEVSLDVDVAFDDGATCRVQGAESKLWPVKGRDSLNPCTNTVFYPGQHVGGSSSRVFRTARWLKGHWRPSRSTGTVSKVESATVLVYWVASSSLGADRSLVQDAAPAHQQRSRDLTFFAAGDRLGFWGLGDRCFFRRVAAGTTPGQTRARRWQQRAGGSRAEFERPMSVAGTRTTVDVLWQDGTRRLQVPSASLSYAARQNIHEFFPGQRVVAKGGAETTRVGVVRSLNFKDQTVRVSWLEADDDEETVVSTYDLGSSFDCDNVFYGDVVVRQRPITMVVGDDDTVARFTGGRAHDISWVGHVVDFSDDTEHVKVKWGDGNTSEVSFHQIAVVKGQSVVELLREIGKWAYQDDSINSAPPVVARAVDHDDDDNNGSGEDVHRETRMGRVGFVFQAVIRLAGKMLAQGWRYLPVGGSTVAEVMPQEFTAMENINEAIPVSSGDGHDNATGDGKSSLRFLNFEIVHQSPSDHHYIDNMEQGTGGGRTKWTKRVQKEWEILENDLPGTIYVRAFEDRMDLLRVAMVGPCGTPYQDGLFFFDMQLPPSYPAAPPLVSYRSFGLRVNPNLYPSGTVCLSLLNTFGGRGCELWSPDMSSLLQVVVSIQGLVLNAQPYYNEADHAAQAGTSEGRRNELPYSENAYLLTLQTMLHLMRRPPAGFEGFVRDHFLRRSRHVLRACRAYVVEGCLVGTLDGDGCPSMEASREQPCTMGFRLALTNMVPRLVEGFTSIGAQGCEGFDRL